MKKFIGEGLKSSGVNLNVLNVLRTLVEDTDSVVYLPYGYKNATVRTSDPRVHMVPIEAGRPVRVLSLKSNKERFNFSILCSVDVMVEFYDGDMIKLVPKKVFRTYNVIRDGKLEINRFSVKLSKSLYEDLRAAGILYYNGARVMENHEYSENFIYKVDLSTIPLVSVNWAQPVNIGLYDMMKEDLEISEKLKVLKKIRNKFDKPSEVVEDEYYTESYTSGDYSEPSLGSEVDCCTYSIVGFKPQYKESDFDGMFSSYNDINEYIKNLTSIQNNDRFMSRCIIFAIGFTKKLGSFEWSDLEDVPRSKDKKRQFAKVNVNGEEITLERRIYKKLV